MEFEESVYDAERVKTTKEYIEKYPWFTFDEKIDLVEAWWRKEYMQRILKVGTFDTLYKKIIVDFKSLELDDFENFVYLSQLIEQNEILCVYESFEQDPFKSVDNFNAIYNKGVIFPETKVTIFIINELINHDKVNIINYIYSNESKNYDLRALDPLSIINQYARQKKGEIKRIKPLGYKIFLEKDLEKILQNNLNKIEIGLIFIKAQYEVQNGYIDILAEDISGTKCIIELKIVDDCKDLVFQSAYYPTQFNENVRMITICPNYKPKILSALKSIKNIEIKKYYFQGKGLDDQIYIENI